MDAIRNSPNPNRTLEGFWRGQIHSKLWLVKELGRYVGDPATIDIFGGWNGTLASLLFQAPYPIKSIRSIDIDPSCEQTANTMNRIEFESGRFRAITANMCNLRSDSDIAINTSCEHITQDEYEEWLTCLHNNSLIVLQSNDYVIDEHVRVAKSLDEFINQSQLSTVFYADFLQTQLYKRFMIIGKK
jgi:hypothetical protein